ncbi:MAG: protein-glutamate O-methyltransferase family protein [Spirochaetia bacterium]|jgi:hypothetical protein|nr:protein-glutamate O-methyltransferase family protein [Spirochaetia bacterium]
MNADGSPAKPPFISMADAGSFARHTLEARFPQIIGGVMALRPGAENKKLAALRAEAAGGVISDPFAEGGAASSCGRDAFHPQEIAVWRGEIARHLGRPWKEVPFYFAESYLYLRILLACGYHDRSSGYFQDDPWQGAKLDELGRFLSAKGVEGVFAGLARDGGDSGRDAFTAAVLFMLRANRIDLSNAAIVEAGRRLILRGGREDLLVDHTDSLVQSILASRRVDIVLDNAGAELAADLAFARLYLASDPARRLVLHAKKYPTFVSDATIQDVRITAEKLKSSAAAASTGGEIETFLGQGRLRLADHYFWNGPLHFPAMPEDLRRDLAGSCLTLLKGDANFRRMTEDRRWPFSVRLDGLTSWFPGNHAILRTLKSETASDIPEGLSARMGQEDPGWLTNGRWGLVRLVSCTG